MNLQEFKDADEKNNPYTITVFKHKEAHTGPIRVKMDAKLYSWMKLFINTFHPVVTQDTSPTFLGFLTWNGKPFKKSGGIRSALVMPFGGGLVQEVTVALTAMTATREYAHAGYDIHRDLANLMGHKKKTADK